MAQAQALPQSAAGAGNLKWAIAITVALGTFMDVLDNSSVSVALQYIGGNLGASQDDVTWVITILLVAKAVTLPTAGYLATVVGRSRLFMIALVAYGVASLLCGLSTSLTMLLVMRAFQGICGGIIPPLGQAILKDAFPAEERGQAFALYGVATVVAPTVGPLLCGWLVDNYSWHWVFFVNVPVALLTAFLVTALVKDPPELIKEKAAAWAKGLSIDYIGLGLLGVGLSALQYVLSRGERFDWFSSNTIVYPAIASVILLVAGVVWETRAKNPLLDLSLFRNRTFSASIAVMFVVGALLYGTTTQLPQFLQTLLGYRAVDSGLAITPGGIALIFLMPIVGWLTGKVQARWLIMFGLIVSAGSCYYYAHVLSINIDFTTVAKSRVYQSIGLGFLFVPINVAAYVGLAKSKTNQAATFINLFQTLGGSFGIAAIETVLARRTQFHQSRIVDHLTFSNPDYANSLRQSASGVFGHINSSMVDATQQAQGAIYRSVIQQATTIAYDDAFYLLTIVCLASIALVFFMKANKPGEGEGGGAAA